MESMAQGPGYSKEKLEIITVLLDEGEKIKLSEETWIYSNPIAIGNLVTLSENSTLEKTIVRKALGGELAFGYLLNKTQVRSNDNYMLASVIVLGRIFKMPKDKLANDIKPNDNLYVNNNGLVNNEHGHDLKLLAMNKANIEDEDEFINTFRQIGDTTLQSDTKNCLDLRMGEYVQDPYTKIVNLEFEDENNILNQCNFITDADNNTYMEVPDVAILNTIRFLFGGDDKLYMEYSGCDEI